MSDSTPSLMILRDREPETPFLNGLVFWRPRLFSRNSYYALLALTGTSLGVTVMSLSLLASLLTSTLGLLSGLVGFLTVYRQDLIDRGEIIEIPSYDGELRVWQKNLSDYTNSLEKLRQGALKSPEVASAYAQIEPIAWDNIKKATRAVLALHSNDTLDSTMKGVYQRDLAQLIESEKQIEEAHQAANGLVLERARAVIDPEPERQVATNISTQLSALRELESGE